MTICHSKSKKIEEKIYRLRDDSNCAVGNRERFTISGNMVKAGVVIIDVGISRCSGKICGDVDFGFSQRQRQVDYTRARSGVGPMTVAMLLRKYGRRYSLVY